MRSGSVQPAGHCSFYCVYTKGTTPKLQKHGYKNLRGEKLVFKECWYLNTHGWQFWRQNFTSILDFTLQNKQKRFKIINRKVAANTMDLILWRLKDPSTSNSQAKSNLYFASGIVVRTRYPSASENCHVHRRWRAAPSSISRTLLSLTSQPFLGSSRNAPPQCDCCVTTLRRLLCLLSMQKIRDYTQSNFISYNMEKVTAAREL